MQRACRSPKSRRARTITADVASRAKAFWRGIPSRYSAAAWEALAPHHKEGQRLAAGVEGASERVTIHGTGARSRRVTSRHARGGAVS